MPTLKDETKILLDADVVIHFMKAGQQVILNTLFPGRLVMLDKVKQELMKMKSARLPVENFLLWGRVEVIAFPSDREIISEYALLIKTRGNGESACMAVARFQKKYIASSNLKDIRDYCEKHSIRYYTTLDILEMAMDLNVLTETQCDQFITEVLGKDSKLPCKSMAEFLHGKKLSAKKIEK
jgi:predicted nucleic acid-binding protein